MWPDAEHVMPRPGTVRGRAMLTVRASLALLALLGLLLASWAARAGPVNPARAETESLLQLLQDSGCQFYRNGAWYTGAEAKAHLLKKLDYLEGEGMFKSTEDFIHLGGSASSSSGKSYLVRCGQEPPIESKAWLQGKLAALRQGKGH